MYLNIVVIFMYPVAHVMLSLLVYDFILYVGIVKHVVPIAVNVLYKLLFPLYQRETYLKRVKLC